MSLRIHFSGADLVRLTIADAPDPLWELLLSLHMLQEARDNPLFGAWRAQVPVTTGVRELCALAPPSGYSPDFLTPTVGADGLDSGLAAVLSTPPKRMGTELALLATNPGRRSRATGPALPELTRAMAAYHRDAIQPHWARIEKQVHHDRADRTRVLSTGGLDRLLTGLHPTLRWRAPTLELVGHHVHGDLKLNGRGLRLLPSFFCHGAPTTLADPTLPPVLVYPIAHDPAWLSPPSGPRPNAARAALAALLGTTRAHVLHATAHGCTTTQLSNKTGISPASASYHASILRDAGLIDTRREGTAVWHTITPLGAGLLDHHGIQTMSTV